MTNLINDPGGKMQKIKQRQDSFKIIEAVPPICPYMSTPEREVSCTPRCKLYRQARTGYECYHQELQSISWNTRKPKQSPHAPLQAPPQQQY